MKATFILIAALMLILPLFADYSDVLIVSNGNSSVSVQIADYFASQRNVTHRLNVTIPASTSISFSNLNSTLLQPLKAYLQANGSGINYIVLTKGIPLYTTGTQASGSVSASVVNASSVDSEAALINTDYEQYVGAKGRLFNPFYGVTSHFTKARYGIYLVTRLDAYNFTDVQGMIDNSASITKADRESGVHILAEYHDYFHPELGAANLTLVSAGLNVTYNSSASARHPANLANVSYFDTFGCYNFGGCGSGYLGNPNYTWKNGSFASARYSFSASTTSYAAHNTSLIADYLHEGANAGLGYATEPLVTGTANPQIIASNYVRGARMAEMLWSAVPYLSWSAVVFGDPKAGYPHADISLTPAIPTNSSTLNCTITPIYDFAPYMNISYEWYENGTNVTALAGTIEDAVSGADYQLNVTPGNLTVGGIWQCRAIARYNGQEAAISSSTVTVYSDDSMISSCGSLVSPGYTYVLLNNLSNSTGCLTVNATNITLDCNGFSITGNNTGNGIYSNYSETNIRNCRINGFDYGIYFNGAANGSIINTTSASSNGSAIYLVSASNIAVTNSSGTSTTSYGISLNSDFNCTFADSSGTSDSRYGALIFYSYNNTFVNFTGTTNSSLGIYIGNSPNNTFVNATGTSSSLLGIVLTSSSGNTFINSTGASGSSNGFYFSSSNSNNVSNSAATSNSNYAMYFITSCSNIISNSTITSGSSYGIGLNPGSNGNAFLENAITGVYWVSDSGTGNAYNTSSAGNRYYFANGTGAWAGLSILDLDGDGWADSGADLPFSLGKIPSYWNGNGQDARPYVMAGAVGDGTSISTALANLSVSIGNATNFSGMGFAENTSVSISSGNSTIVLFSHNFTMSQINFSRISIENGSYGGKSYLSVSGIDPSCLIGGKTLTIYGANPNYTQVCIKEMENMSYQNISSNCTGESEYLLGCDGNATNGTSAICTSPSAGVLQVSGLLYSAVEQYRQPENGTTILLLNGAAANFTAAYGTSLTVNASSSSGTQEIYLNGTLVGTSNYTATLAAGYYNITANSSGNENYTASAATFFANITSVSTTTTPGTGSTGSSGGGGGGGGAGGSASTSAVSAAYQVNVSPGIACEIAITRSMKSATSQSVLTTTLLNKGAPSCVLTDFVFSDSIPANFSSITGISFSPEYTAKEGRAATFSFPSFAPGESLSMTYSVAALVPVSRVRDFTNYSMSAKAISLAQPGQPPVQSPSSPESQKPAAAPILPQEQTPVQQQEAQEQGSGQQDNGLLIGALAVAGILAGIAIVGAAIYLLLIKHKKKGL